MTGPALQLLKRSDALRVGDGPIHTLVPFLELRGSQRRRAMSRWRDYKANSRLRLGLQSVVANGKTMKWSANTLSGPVVCYGGEPRARLRRPVVSFYCGACGAG